MNDRTPGIEIDDALKLLSERYGFKRVRCLATGNVVFVDMLLESGATFHRGSNYQQAKYLAMKPLRAEALKTRKLPRDWPK